MNENIFCQTCAYLSAIACASLFAHERKFSQHGLSTFLLYFFPCPALYFSLFIIIMNVFYPCISFSYSLFYLYLRLSFYNSFTHRKSFHLPIYFNPRKNLWDIINVEKYLWDVEKPVTPFCRRLQTDKCETTKKFKLLFPISRMNERYRNKF